MALLAVWLWLLVVLALVLAAERWLTQHLSGIWLLLLRHPDAAATAFSLLLLPGVVLHEVSHWLAATLLGVTVHGFSLTPQRLPDGTLEMGHVEVTRPDFLRASLIGLAPLVFGAAAVIWIGNGVLGLQPLGTALAQGDLWQAGQLVGPLTHQPNFWLWLYLLFAISNSMMPSASDRRAWPTLLVVAVFITGFLVWAGWGAALVPLLAPLETVVSALATALSITLGLDLALLPVVWGVEKLVEYLSAAKVDYRAAKNLRK